MKKRFEYKTVEIKPNSIWAMDVPAKELDEILTD